MTPFGSGSEALSAAVGRKMEMCGMCPIKSAGFNCCRRLKAVKPGWLAGWLGLAADARRAEVADSDLQDSRTRRTEDRRGVMPALARYNRARMVRCGGMFERDGMLGVYAH